MEGLEIAPTAAHPDDHSQQHSHMYPHPRDKVLAETEPTALPRNKVVQGYEDTATLTNAQLLLPNNKHH